LRISVLQGILNLSIPGEKQPAAVVHQKFGFGVNASVDGISCWAPEGARRSYHYTCPLRDCICSVRDLATELSQKLKKIDKSRSGAEIAKSHDGVRNNKT
jgi:hypothetical protein